MTKITVLLVEDDNAVRYAVKEFLKHALNAYQFKILDFGSAPEALTAIAENDFDLVVSDLNLQGHETGLDVIAAAKAKNSSVPCVLMSGGVLEEDARKVRDMEKATGFSRLDKPISLSDFCRIIQALLS